MQSKTSRRVFLRLLAGVPLLAAGSVAVPARDESLIGRLIREARSLPEASSTIAQRIQYISGKLLGVRYRAYTLIGGPRHQEKFVVRADAFDCVTFCEVVLAAARAQDFDEFEAHLRKIRYRHGKVSWTERNHYFAEWSSRAVKNGICRPVAITPMVTIEKTVNWERFGRRKVSMTAISGKTLLANKHLLEAGDIVGFVSHRPRLDFFHTGLIAFGPKGALMLRHASRSRGRVLDQRMDRFIAANGVRYVTLLRAVDPPPAAKHA